MANELTVFKYMAHDVRVVGDDPNNPWFVVKDVCDILGLANPADVVGKGLRENEKGIETIYTPGGPQEMAVVSEPGLYRLVFRSSKPAAEAFRDFVFSAILPTIRKTGQYVAPASPALPAPTQRLVDTQFALDYVKKTALDIGVNKDMIADITFRVLAREGGWDEEEFHALIPPRPQSEYRYIPTSIAPLIGATGPRQANKMLEAKGLQDRKGREWHLTDEGMKYAECQMYVDVHGSGHSGPQIKWSERVAELFTDKD